MKLGILSDTHDKLQRTQVAVDMLVSAGAEVLIHCGDLTGPAIIEACATRPCYFVFGNNDDYSIPDLQRAAVEFGAVCLGWGDVIEISGKRVGLVHGHLTTDLRRLMLTSPDYLFSGHSHERSDTRVGSVRRINPGALHRAESFSVAVLDLESDELQFLTVPR